MQIKGRRAGYAALLGATMLAGFPVYAQQGTPAPAKSTAQPSAPSDTSSPTADQPAATNPGQEGDTSRDVIVTGYRQSYADAIRSKRNQISITDGISSDGLGRFPDLNVGEALQRVPGIQINREAEGRNATINLRGLPGEYARLTFNGVAFAEPILSDATPLGAFNSDIFSAIVIDKSPLANAQSGGLSGNIDLEAATALSRKEGGSIKVAMEYNQFDSRYAPAVTAGYNHRFSDTFAVFGIVAYKHENFRRDGILFNNYTAFSPAQAQANASTLGAYYATSAACPACTGSIATTGVLYNSQLRQYSRTNVGNLYSGAAGAEWKPDDRTNISVTGFYTDRQLPKTLQYLAILSNSNSSVLTALGAPIKLSDGRYVSTDIDFANPSEVVSTRLFAQHQKAWGVNGKGEWTNDGWRLSTIVTASKASNSSEETEFDFETLPTAAGNGLSGTIRTGAGDISNLYFKLSPNPAVTATAPNGWFWGGVGDPTTFYDASTTANRTRRLRFTGSQGYASNELLAAQGDIERTFEGSVISGLQAGFRFEHNKYVSTGYRTSAFGLQTQNVDASFLQPAPIIGNFFDGQGGTTSTNWQYVPLEYALGRTTPVSVYPGGQLSPLGFNIQYNENNYQLNNFSNQTNLAIGYAQVKYDLMLGSVRVRGSGGLRYESARNTVVALDRVSLTGTIGAPSDFRTHTYEQSYGKWLPSFIAVADLTDKLVLRAAAYRTYVRPQPRQFAPVTLVNGPTNGVYTVTLGNPDLKPYDGTSLDLSLEWYNRPNGIITFAAFQKRVTGLITQITDPKRLCPADATALGLGTLTVNGDQCQSSLIFTGGPVPVPFLVAASGFVNQSSPITVRGVEFNIQQSLDFLPGLLRHLGGGFNYAYTTISGKNANGSTATLPGVSKHNANLIGYFETDTFGIRLVYNYRSSYDLAGAGTFTGAARSVRARGQLDLSTSLNINKRFSLSIDGYNLTNAIRVEYENDPRLARRADYDGRTFTLTARATF